MKINREKLYKRMLVGVIAVIVSVTVLSKLATTATSVEAATPAPCIVTLSGIQYNVAPLTVPGVHPGGNIFVCGTDMTTLFMSMPTHAADIARMTPYIYVSPTQYHEENETNEVESNESHNETNGDHHRKGSKDNHGQEVRAVATNNNSSDQNHD